MNFDEFRRQLQERQNRIDATRLTEEQYRILTSNIRVNNNTVEETIAQENYERLMDMLNNNKKKPPTNHFNDDLFTLDN